MSLKTFEDRIEQSINPTIDRAPQVRKLCFVEASCYLTWWLIGKTDLSPSEVPAEIVKTMNPEGIQFQQDFIEDVEKIIELGIAARRRQLHKQLGLFKYLHENEDENNEADDEHE